MRKSVQSKRKCFTEKGSWQGIHWVQSSLYSKNEYDRSILKNLCNLKESALQRNTQRPVLTFQQKWVCNKSMTGLFYNLVAIHQAKAW